MGRGRPASDIWRARLARRGSVRTAHQPAGTGVAGGVGGQGVTKANDDPRLQALLKNTVEYFRERAARGAVARRWSCWIVSATSPRAQGNEIEEVG